MTKPAPQQTDLAKGLCLTPARVSQLKTAGMPVTSLAAAKKWIAKKTKDSDGTKPGSLAEGRLKKILLECAILEARLEKENDQSEFMPTSQLEHALYSILQYMQFGLQREAESLSSKLAGLDEVSIYPELKLWMLGSFLDGAVQMIERTTIDGRLSRVARKVVAESIVKVRPPKQETVSHHHA